MKEVLLYMGVFVVGYILTMGVLFVVLKGIFPGRTVEAEEDLLTLIKYNSQRSSKKTRKIKAING